MRKINKLIVHCDATDNPDQNNLEAVSLLHTAKPSISFNWGKYKTHGKGFIEVGYQYYIDKQARVFIGRDIERSGAHCRGHNHDSVGICVAGENNFTSMQMKALKELCESICLKYCIDPTTSVFPHNHFDKNKTCPNFKIPDFEKWPDRDIHMIGDIEE